MCRKCAENESYSLVRVLSGDDISFLRAPRFQAFHTFILPYLCSWGGCLLAEKALWGVPSKLGAASGIMYMYVHVTVVRVLQAHGV